MKQISTYILLFLNLTLLAQNNHKITLSTPQTTGGEIVVAELITLAPGFSFTSGKGKSLNLKIDITLYDPDNDPTFPPSPLYLSKDQNYILTRTYMQDDGKRFLDQIQYFDALGRPNQTIQRGVTPNGSDLVSLQEYDAFGRESESWLPGVVTGNKGAFVTLNTVKERAKASNLNDINPFSTPIYEASPLNRVIEQYGPGADWRKSTDKRPISTDYLTNTASGVLSCALFTVDGTGSAIKVKKNNYYSAGQLYVTKITDEDKNVSYEFKDKLGQVVLTRQMVGTTQHDTYYVYDDFGNLCFVLPPLASDGLIPYNGSWDDTNATGVKQFAYLYKYDHRRRCTWKKLPGCEPIFYVYDKADQLIFTQDGEQRKKGEWAFSIPDAFGRTALTGVCKNTLTVGNQIEAVVKATLPTPVVTNTTMGYTVSGIDLTIPLTITSANYYDNYNFLGYNDIPNSNDTKYVAETGYGTQYTNAKGMLTGSVVAQMNGTTTKLYSVMYYDNRGRLIQSKSNNHLTGGFEKEYIAYNFTGQPTKKLHVHSATGKTTQTELYAYTYDHAGRLLDTKHKWNTGAETLIASNTYDELGRLKTNKKGGNASLNTTYAYNIRSWTTSISSPLYTQKLYYNTSINGSVPRYGGDITAINWINNTHGNTNRFYNYTYDGLSRLLTARYGEGSTINNRFTSVHSYDKHGNMMTLKRNGNATIANNPLVDDLLFTYQGNQLATITDNATAKGVNASMDVQDYTKRTTEYTFNANGAITQDLNKGISDIKYNSLNLPMQTDINSPNAEARIKYTYSASGVKLKVEKDFSYNRRTMPIEGLAIENIIGKPITMTNLDRNTYTDYVGNKIYENGSLKRILTDGGYIEGGKYYYYLTDHLGNNVVVGDANGKAIQATNYYPFGMDFAGGGDGGVQPYRYNGKELDQEHGLNMYDYAARYMDPVIGRFSSVDPLAEKYYSWSPYVYCFNNPLRFIDKDGRAPGDVFKTVRAAATDWGNYYNGASILRGNEFGSTIYKSSDGGYAYSVANEGDYKSVVRSEAPNGEKRVGIIHSHGEFLNMYKNNEFSTRDKSNSKKEGVNSYVATPDGSLLEFDVKKGDVNVISEQMPSDPKDPARKNETKPIDIPKQTTESSAKAVEELKKREEFRGAHGGNSTMNP